MTTRARMNARLPSNYFADAQDHLPARQTTTSGHHSPHGTTGDSPALAKPAPADDAVAGGRGLLSAAAHFARNAAGVGHQVYAVAAKRIAHGQQLRAARRIFGQPSLKPHVSR